jgi:hypothetical protein
MTPPGREEAFAALADTTAAYPCRFRRAGADFATFFPRCFRQHEPGFALVSCALLVAPAACPQRGQAAERLSDSVPVT